MDKHLLATAAVSLALVLPAVSQETTAPEAGGTTAPGAMAPEQPLPPLAPVDMAGMTAEQLIGISVINAQEQTLGTVDDAVLSADGKGIDGWCVGLVDPLREGERCVLVDHFQFRP